MPLSKSQTASVAAGAPACGRPRAETSADRMDRAERATAGELYERYLPDVYRYVFQRVPRVEDAEDITAEVFAAAAAGLPRFRGQCPLYLWLLSIARRKIIDARRRRTARRETLASELDDEEPDAQALWAAMGDVESPEAALMRAEARRVLRELVARLSPDQREALMLQYMERLSVAEIAVVMGRSPASVYSLLKRARAALHRHGRSYFLGDEGQEG
jgi:RNA polymerase sigma-70 factor, ECF subfamily